MHQPENPERRTRPSRNHLGAALFSFAAIFCATEFAPGWGFLNTNWPWPVYYSIMILCGAFAGSREVPLRWAGAVGGAVAGAGSLFVLSVVLKGANSVPKLMLIAAMLAGMLPGVGLYYLLKEATRIANGAPPPPEPDAPEWMGDAAGRRRRLYIVGAVFAVAGLVVLLLLALKR